MAMTKILVAILTSGKPEKLERCIQSVTNNSSLFERIVICNSNDENFINLASQISYDNNINFKTSISNGTPGKGKNSVIKHFLKSDCDWLFQIDGDDYITEKSIEILYNAIETQNFDAACLINNKAIAPSGELIFASDIPMQPSVAKKFLRYATQDNLNLYLSAQEIGKKYSYDGRGLNRLLLINRKVAMNVKFNEHIKVTEDFLFLQEIKKKYIVQTVDTNLDPVYIYDYADGITDALIESGELIQHLKMLLAYHADDDYE
jgi:hypothetical protein